MSAFDSLRGQIWPYRYEVELHVPELHGGVPQDPRTVEAWIRSILIDSDQRILRLVRETINELGYTQEDLADSEKMERAITETAKKNLNGFKRNQVTGELYIEGRAVKAMLKEAANIAYPWSGKTASERVTINGKSVKGAFKEHVFVEELQIPLGVKDPDDVNQRFATGNRGQRTIVREEYLENAVVVFHLNTDLDMPEEFWGRIMLTAELQGLGTARSQGYGTFTTVRFELVSQPKSAEEVDSQSLGD